MAQVEMALVYSINTNTNTPSDYDAEGKLYDYFLFPKQFYHLILNDVEES
jgi:hypothetical protein